MIMLTLDPSSTCTGWALWEDGELVDFGRFLGRGKDPIVRIDAMCDLLHTMLRAKDVDWVVIEISSGHVGGRHRGGGAGLATYGMAVGALRAVCRRWCTVEEVAENDWTRGRPKRQRTAEIGCIVPRYRSTADPGGDVADAIGLGLWWLQEQRVRQA